MSFAGTLLAVVTGIVAILGAVGCVAARRPLRAAVGLLVHIVALAAMFLTLHAQLLAALQLLVYAGAVVVLFVFVIMLIGPAAEVGGADRALVTRVIGGALAATVAGLVASALGGFEGPWRALPEGFGSLESIGRAIYRGALIPFELVSITLLIAIIGAVAIASGRRVDAKKAGRDLPAAAPKLHPGEQEVPGE